MTIRMLIKELLIYPNLDAQVVDKNGSPIMTTSFYAREDSENVTFNSKSQIDITKQLDLYFDNIIDSTMDDRECLEQLYEMGYTLDDLKKYREDTYQWALAMEEE